VEPIRGWIYTVLRRHLRSHPSSLRHLHPLARLAPRFDVDAVYHGLDYVLATAVKPVAAGQ
jgi:hypothetical protein